MIDIRQAKRDLLDRIVTHDSDLKTSLNIATFLVKQLKHCKDAEEYDLMYSKLDILLKEFTEPYYIDPVTGQTHYPTIESTIKIYEVFQLVLKEKENFVRPDEVFDSVELTEEQLQSLDRLSEVMDEYKQL